MLLLYNSCHLFLKNLSCFKLSHLKLLSCTLISLLDLKLSKIIIGRYYIIGSYKGATEGSAGSFC